MCSTPIGNLRDATFRLVDVLLEADIVLAEDTRQSRKLLTHFDIHDKRLVSYHQHNEAARMDELTTWWAQGLHVALLSDAGTPAISDPGFQAVQRAIAEGIPVIPIPGASAVLAAVVASGLVPQPFAFYGFPPRGSSQLGKFLTTISALPLTVILYESPHRLEQTLAALRNICPDRALTVGRELTKRYESFLRGSVESVYQAVQEYGVKGECVLVLAPAMDEAGQPDEDALAKAIEMVQRMRAQGLSHKQAVTFAVEQTGARKRDVYQQTLREDSPAT